MLTGQCGLRDRVFMTKNCKNISVIYYGLVFVAYVLAVFIPSVRTGVFASLVLVAIAFQSAFFLIKSENKSDFISLLNICVFAYLIYNFLSFIWILCNGYPISIYVEEFSNSVLPIVFYFAAVIVCQQIKSSASISTKIDAVYKGFLYSFSVFSVICIILYLWAPQFYCDFLYNMSLISKADASTCRVRMEGVTGSTSLSYIAVAAMLVAARFMYKSFFEYKISSAKKDNDDSIDSSLKCRSLLKEFALYSVLFIFSLAVVFLANGRAGMVAALLVIVYINFLVFLSFKFLDKKYLYIEIAAIIVLLIAMCVVTPGITAKIWARLVSLPGAVGQRSEQWVSAINNMPGKWWGQWFGNGLGANGHKAIGIEGAHVVPDGGLVKLYCEEGAVGFSLFVYIMLVTFRNGMKNLRNSFCELGIIGTALLMSIGSNIIAFQLCVPVFWFAVGAVAVLGEKNGGAK